MKAFPAFCIDDFYENPDEVREFALQQTYHKMPGCVGLRTSPMKEIDPGFDDFFSKKFLSMFYNVLDPNFSYEIKNVFHKNYIDDQHKRVTCSPEELIMGAPYKSEFVSNTSAHLDKNYCSGVIFLNKNEETHAGSAIYRPIKFYEEHDGALLQETARFHQIYNRLVCFDGDTWHGRVGDNTKEDRLCQVFFVYRVNSDIPLPLRRRSIVPEYKFPKSQ